MDVDTGTVTSVLDLITKGGLVGFLLLVLVGGQRQWWVFGWQYQDRTKEMNEWKQIALTNTKLLDKSIDAK